MGRCRACRGQHGSFRSAGHGAGDRGGLSAERCGMSHALVDLARALVGWLRGGLGMSVIVVSYFFSDICGSKMAEVSALSATLMQIGRASCRERGEILVVVV